MLLLEVWREVQGARSHIKDINPGNTFFVFCLTLLQSSVKKFLSGFGNCWQEYGAILGWAAQHFEGDSRDFAGMFLHNSIERWPKRFVLGCMIPPLAVVLVHAT